MHMHSVWHEYFYIHNCDVSTVARELSHISQYSHIIYIMKMYCYNYYILYCIVIIFFDLNLVAHSYIKNKLQSKMFGFENSVCVISGRTNHTVTAAMVVK